MAKTWPEVPQFLTGDLQTRWEELAPVLWKMGTLTELEVPLLTKYILAEENYLRVSDLLHTALGRADSEDAQKWAATADRITKETLVLAQALGMTSESRRARGLIYPGS